MTPSDLITELFAAGVLDFPADVAIRSTLEFLARSYYVAEKHRLLSTSPMWSWLTDQNQNNPNPENERR